MTTVQEQESPAQENRDPSLVDMAEMLAQIADKLLSAALVMAALSEKEVPKGSLIERLLQAGMPPQVVTGYQQWTSSGATSAPQAPIIQPPQQGKWRRNKQPPNPLTPPHWPSVGPWTTGGTAGGFGHQWQTSSFNMAQFEKAVTEYVTKSLSIGTNWTK